MTTIDRFQEQRYELKYLVSPRQAMQVREVVRCFLEPDDYSASAGEEGYPVHSIYLDSDELATYWATVHCRKRRFKLRVRFYDDLDASPAFLELKSRNDGTIRKQRAAVRREYVAAILDGERPDPARLLGGERHLAAAETFVMIAQRMRARPVVHVAYRREAWVEQAGNAVRVTLDRDVRGERVGSLRLSTAMRDAVAPFHGMVILELKFTNRFPAWFGELVRRFDLTQCGVPKYCGSVAIVGEERVAAPPSRAATLAPYL